MIDTETTKAEALIADARRTLLVRGHRTIVSADGVVWYLSSVLLAEGKRLRFISADCVREVVVQPDAAEMSDDDLHRLLAASAPQTRTVEISPDSAGALARLDAIERDLTQQVIDSRLALHRVVGVCVQAELFHLLTAHEVPHPTYNYLRSYADSVLPWDRASRPQGLGAPAWKVLGFDVFLPIGVPASVLTRNADWVRYYCSRGFNIITFKTVRTGHRDPHPAPNWLFVSGFDTPIPVGSDRSGIEAVASEEYWPPSPATFSMTNSFGIPSGDPKEWHEELSNAVQAVGPGRLLLASVVGNERLQRLDLIAADYAKAAMLACDCGVRGIELNLSCPNTLTDGRVKEDMLGADPQSAMTICQVVRAALPRDVRLIVKLGYMEREHLKRVLAGVIGEVDAVSGINTLQVRVRSSTRDADGFAGRSKAGLSGIALRDLARDFVRNVVDLRKELGRPEVEVLAMGGGMNADDAENLLAEGASAVQSATAAFFHPTVAVELAQRYESRSISAWEAHAAQATLATLSAGPKSLSE